MMPRNAINHCINCRNVGRRLGDDNFCYFCRQLHFPFSTISNEELSALLPNEDLQNCSDSLNDLENQVFNPNALNGEHDMLNFNDIDPDVNYLMKPLDIM